MPLALIRFGMVASLIPALSPAQVNPPEFGAILVHQRHLRGLSSRLPHLLALPLSYVVEEKVRVNLSGDPPPHICVM